MNNSEYRISDIDRKLEHSGLVPLDVMITGVTGAGKSTTLNSLFEKTVATVGDGVNPETMQLDAYKLNDWLRLWDTPGLGDSVEADAEHKKKMVKLLRENSINRFCGLIDLVIVVIEGSKRDLGMTLVLLEEVILPNIEASRVLVVINQADVAMKGRHWDTNRNCPDPTLKNYLDDFALSLQKRILRDMGLNIPLPIYYSAEKGYNIERFMDIVIDNIPNTSRPPQNVSIAKGCCSDISMGQTYFDYDEEERAVSFEFDFLKNDSSIRQTGELDLICWISDCDFDKYDGWGTDNFHLIGERFLGHLAGGESFSKRRFTFELPEELPVRGLWNFVFTINELRENNEWMIIDYRNADGGYN